MANKIKYLVVDTAGFIENAPLQELAENVITINGVLDEIKSKRQLKRLVVLPYDLKVQEPTPESIRHVVNFAKKTGDYASLSSVDIKVIALTYELEKEHVGVEHLRKEPALSKTIITKPNPHLHTDSSLAGFYTPKSRGTKSENEETREDKNHDQLEGENESESNGSISENELENRDETEHRDSIEQDDEEMADELIEQLAKLDCLRANNENIDENDILKSCDKSEDKSDIDEEEEDDDDDDDDDDEDEEEDDEGWITPSNLVKIKKDLGKDIKLEKPVVVACMTTDFSVQNTLKQIGLNLSAIDGRVIKETRTFILRCYACFKTTTLMHKVFCPNCGNKTLKRCAVSIDENGQQIVHINFRRPITAKGKNISLPRPKGGKHSCNPILFEDQPMPKQMPSRMARTKTNALDEDYIAGYSPFVTRDVDSKSALLRTKGNVKEWMRNNDYQNNRRKKKVF